MLGLGIVAILALCGVVYVGLRRSRKNLHIERPEPFPPYDWFLAEQPLDDYPPHPQSTRSAS